MNWIRRLRSIAVLAVVISAFWGAPQGLAADDCYDDGNCTTCYLDDVDCFYLTCNGWAEWVC